MQINAVQVIAGLLRGDGEARLVEQPFQVKSGDREFMGHLTGGEIGEVLGWQRLQGEPGLARGQRQAVALRIAQHLDFGAVGQLAHDVVQHVRRYGHGPRRRHLGRRLLDHLALEIGSLELELARGSLQQNVRKDRDGRAPLNNAGDVAQRPQELASFDH